MSGSPSSPPSIFDPFAIGPNHSDHSQLTYIVRLEESGRIFCPLCLENTSLTMLNRVEDGAFKQYIDNLFEALDQNSEVDQLRKIALTILEIILVKKPFQVSDANMFHNHLRIIYKIMKSERFDPIEFSMITKIFSILLIKFVPNNPIPITSVWKNMRYMLDYAKANLSQYKISNIHQDDHESFRFIRHIAMTIDSYLKITRKFSIDKVADLIFPLAENSNIICSRKYYIESQSSCLEFMSSCLIPHLWPHLVKLEHPLGYFGKKLVSAMIDAMSECFSTSIRLKSENFLKYLTSLDCILIAHLLIYKNSETELRSSLRKFLKSYTFYYVEKYLGEDNEFSKYLDMEDIIETNHKNAIALCTDEVRYKRTTFYIVINYVAIRQNSHYYNSSRVKKVIKCVDPTKLGLNQSKVLMRAYLSLAEAVISKVTSSDNVERFLRRTWRRLSDQSCQSEFEEQFCFNKKILFWIYEHPEFMRLVTVKNMRYILQGSITEKSILNDMQVLLKNAHYKNLICRFMKEDDSAASIIEEVVNREKQIIVGSRSILATDFLTSQLSSLVFALFQNCILESTNNAQASSYEQALRLTSIVVALARSVKHFKLVLDQQFIEDIFKFTETLYEMNTNEQVDDVLEALNEFFIVLIETNNPYLMQVLKKLDYFVMGYMCNRLADYTIGDKLGESIARLLVIYDELDYPLIHKVQDGLHPMAQSIMNWTLSQNNDLHILSLMLAQKVLNTTTDLTTKACITTGLIHILSTNSKILHKKLHYKNFLSVVDYIKYNPLINYILETESDSISEDLRRKLCENDEQRTPSPALSIISSGGRSYFGDEHNSVFNILNQLHDHASPCVDSIPTNLLVTRGGVHDHHTNMEDTEDWEQLAADITRNVADAF